MHILDKPLDLPEQGADKVLSGASKVGRRDRGHAKNPVFSQFLLSDGTPLITSKSVCQQPANSIKGPASRWRSPPAFLVKVGEGVDEGEAVGAAGWVVAADRAVAAAAAAALSPHGRRGEVDPRSAIPARAAPWRRGGPCRDANRSA